MVIRQKQMERIAEIYRDTFVQQAAQHLRRYYPERTVPMTETALAEEIRYGIERAGVYGFNTQRDITKYLNLMFEFNRNFDLDPNCPWAYAILTDSQPNRVERLCDAGRAALTGGSDVGR